MAIPFEDQESVLKDVCERFEKLDIPYMLSGSMAMIAYAMMRMTNDIDLVIEAEYQDAGRIVKAFEDDYYLSDIRIKDAISRRRMFNLLHLSKIVKVDCVVRKENEFQSLAFANRKNFKFADFDLWIISRDDLILSKLLWAKQSRSEMQLRDVASIIRNGFDEDYVNKWSGKLGVDDLLARSKEILDTYAE